MEFNWSRNQYLCFVGGTYIGNLWPVKCLSFRATVIITIIFFFIIRVSWGLLKLYIVGKFKSTMYGNFAKIVKLIIIARRRIFICEVLCRYHQFLELGSLRTGFFSTPRGKGGYLKYALRYCYLVFEYS